MKFMTSIAASNLLAAFALAQPPRYTVRNLGEVDGPLASAEPVTIMTELGSVACDAGLKKFTNAEFGRRSWRRPYCSRTHGAFPPCRRLHVSEESISLVSGLQSKAERPESSRRKITSPDSFEKRAAVHVACSIDMYGRSGQELPLLLLDAMKAVRTLPKTL